MEYTSRLAQNDHWRDVYNEELLQFKDSLTLGDEWYNEYQTNAVAWIDEKWSSWTATPREEAQVIDIGTGNGLFLARLASIGFSSLCGIDYMESAIRCAEEFNRALQSRVAYLDDLDDCQIAAKQYTFIVEDITAATTNPKLHGLLLQNKPLFLHDKGTLDVFFLRNQIPEMVKQVESKYAKHPRTVWVISSGNLTPDELVAVIHSNSNFREIDRMTDAPTFMFAGSSGSALTTVAFKLQSSSE